MQIAAERRVGFRDIRRIMKDFAETPWSDVSIPLKYRQYDIGRQHRFLVLGHRRSFPQRNPFGRIADALSPITMDPLNVKSTSKQPRNIHPLNHFCLHPGHL